MRRLGPGLLARSAASSVARPVQALGRRLVRHAFPPHAAFGRQRHVGEDRVPRQRRHRIRIGLHRRARRHAEESGLRIDRAQPAVRVRLDPGDVVAHRPDLPAVERLRAESAWRNWSCRRRSETPPPRRSSRPCGSSTPRISMCSAIQPSSRAMFEAMRSAKHFLPSSALPP